MSQVNGLGRTGRATRVIRGLNGHFARQPRGRGAAIIERMEVDLVFSRVHDKHDLVILDIGTHHGEFLDIFEGHSDNHRYRVICVEPLATNCRQLRQRIASYGRVSATLCEVAVSDVPATRTFYLGSETSLFTCTPEWLEAFPESFARSREMQIECVTVPEVLRRAEVSATTRFDLLKVDTEGHDRQVLSSFIASEATADAVIFEVGRKLEDVDASVEMLRDAGYAEFYLFGRTGIPTTYVGEYAGLAHLRSLFERGRVVAGNVVAFC